MSDIMNTAKSGLGALLTPENSIHLGFNYRWLGTAVEKPDVATRMLIEFLR